MLDLKTDEQLEWEDKRRRKELLFMVFNILVISFYNSTQGHYTTTVGSKELKEKR